MVEQIPGGVHMSTAAYERLMERLAQAEAAPPTDLLAQIEERRADESFWQRFRDRAAEDGELLDRIADDEMLIADLRARVSHLTAELEQVRAALSGDAAPRTDGDTR